MNRPRHHDACAWSSTQAQQIHYPSSCLLFVQKQTSDAHVDLAAYDHATLAVAAALPGHEGGAQLSELPVLPVAPWNCRPGYLVSMKLAPSCNTFDMHLAWCMPCAMLRDAKLSWITRST
jgi:hypothetical protein